MQMDNYWNQPAEEYHRKEYNLPVGATKGDVLHAIRMEKFWTCFYFHNHHLFYSGQFPNCVKKKMEEILMDVDRKDNEVFIRNEHWMYEYYYLLEFNQTFKTLVKELDAIDDEYNDPDAPLDCTQEKIFAEMKEMEEKVKPIQMEIVDMIMNVYHRNFPKITRAARRRQNRQQRQQQLLVGE